VGYGLSEGPASLLQAGPSTYDFSMSLLNTVETSPLASQLFYWCGDWGYEATLSKYGVPNDAKVTKKFFIDKVPSYVYSLI